MHGHIIARTHPAMLKISFPCDLNEVREAVAGVHDFLAKEGWSADDLMSFDLALVEACNNAIQHAPGQKRSQPIVLETMSDPKQVEFRVHDHTPGFDWPQKIELPPPESENGRGLYLIRTLMDDTGYLRGQDENILVMHRARAKNSLNC
ncbi:MAG TPA: ATP-binding protein [Verrucomicrobiae bacterium]|jgi:anti-sigma regulatory factor (Ser/Thr protein kinase)|nr:ATP-binding protein [Verrucomicrobiae bacterium]